MNPPSEGRDDVYAKVIEIAQEQAQSQAAMAELHRQNVAKMDTLSTLMSAQTNNLIAVSGALQHLHEARQRDIETFEKLRQQGLKEIKDHVTTEFKERETKFWIALIIIAVTGSAEVLSKVVSMLKN